MMELEHVGIAVGDAASALAMIRQVLGEVPYKTEIVETDGVRTHFIRGGGAKIELLEAIEDESPIARFVRKRGPGLHHLAFEVDDLEGIRDRLRQAGLRVLDDAPRPGADGKLVFFLHPGDTGDVLFEFCRRERSILETFVVEIGERQRYVLRRAGRPDNPTLMIVSHGVEDVEALASRLEQTAFVLVADGTVPIDGSELLESLGLDSIHLAATVPSLSQFDLPEARVRSTTVFVIDDAEPPPIAKNVLFAAKKQHAAAAVRLWSKAQVEDLVVADGELIARAIEHHVRRHEK